uniref:Uncharacterized protein n=1 Tax=Timema shepardi TaxID=629360 RepID=A0A7R9FZM5_TIMSH|nr:unnamed protein product [Timema shepardi]
MSNGGFQTLSCHHPYIFTLSDSRGYSVLSSRLMSPGVPSASVWTGVYIVWTGMSKLCEKCISRGYNAGRLFLNRKRKVVKIIYYSNGKLGTSFFPSSPEEDFRIDIYYRGPDKIIVNLPARFSKNDYKLLLKWKEPLNDAATKDIQKFYKVNTSVIPQLCFYGKYAHINFTNLN